MAGQMVIVTKTIGRGKVKLFDDARFRRDLMALNQQHARQIKRSFERTTRTWEEKVEFQQHVEVRQDSVVAVYTTNRIYGFVSGGTSVRRALMSPDYDPKTKPGVLDSFPGAGHVVFISRKLALPGIEARRFPALVEKKHAKRYWRDVESAIRQAARRR